VGQGGRLRHRVAARSVLDALVSVGLPGREVGRAALERLPPLEKSRAAALSLFQWLNRENRAWNAVLVKSCSFLRLLAKISIVDTKEKAKGKFDSALSGTTAKEIWNTRRLAETAEK
jgi:hypothetical protein